MMLSLPGSSLQRHDSSADDSMVQVVPAIMANGGDLQQVFVNLITNAEQAVVASREKDILVATEAGADSIRVIVADHGGRISVADSELGGAAFIVELPLGG